MVRLVSVIQAFTALQFTKYHLIPVLIIPFGMKNEHLNCMDKDKRTSSAIRNYVALLLLSIDYHHDYPITCDMYYI